MISGRYELERQIGRGGMGSVWLAEDRLLGRQVAMKRVGMMPDGTNPDLRRAEREARLAARLNHPHVVAIYDFVEHDDDQWLVMEYVAGRTLAQLVRDDGPLDPDAAAGLMVQAAEALTAAHAAGIVHRDVKPANMLITESGVLKLSDFGIARAEADASLTQTGLVTGSPAYLAPEVVSGRLATTASDVWSLGASLYHALSGRPPYDVNANLVGALYQIVHDDPPRLDDSGWLDPMLRATMESDPERRWSMAQVRDFLVSGESDAGAPVPPPAEPTRQIAAPPPAVPATPSLSFLEEPERTAAAAYSSGQDQPRGRRSVFMPALALIALAAIGVIWWSAAALMGDSPTASAPSASAAASETPSESASPSATGMDEAGMTNFIRGYLALAVDDPKRSWESLTPAFQKDSGFGEYKKFWNSVSSSEAIDV